MTSSVSVSKASKWLSSKNKSFKLMSLPRGLKKSLSSSSSSSDSPRSTIPSPVAQHLSPRNKQDEFKEVFRYFDGDGDGKISSLELKAYFGSIGEYMSHEEAQVVINDLDNDGDGLLDFNDFMVLMKQPSTSPTTDGSSSSAAGNDEHGHNHDDEDIRMAFEMYEAEKGCGCITPRSLQRMLNRLGDEKSYEQCVAMIQVFDLDNNGTLDFHEFNQMMA